MMRLPWKQVRRVEGGPVAVSATELRLRRYRDVPALMVDALRLRRHFGSGQGAIAVGLAASPLRRTFWTLTTWGEAADVDRYYRASEHAEVMRRFRGKLEHARSVRWTSSESRPSWTAALAQLEQAASDPT